MSVSSVYKGKMSCHQLHRMYHVERLCVKPLEHGTRQHAVTECSAHVAQWDLVISVII